MTTMHTSIVDTPEMEEDHRKALLSSEWDVGDCGTPRLSYAIFSLARTGGAWLSDHLRHLGVGVPLTYLGACSIAARLDCLDAAGNTQLDPYFRQLLAKRTTSNGIFGIEIHPVHLRSVAHDQIEAAADFFRAFDRVLVLRRRDKLLQAISMVRAPVDPCDTAQRPNQADGALFAAIATELEDIVRDERYVERVLAHVDLSKVRGAWYEDLSEPVIDQIAAWLSNGAEPIAVARDPYAGQPLPRRANAEEALALKQRFLAHISGETN